MAHGITKRDKQQGREMGWHGLTDIVSDLDINNNWLRSWDIEEAPLYTENDIEVPFRILVGSDDKQVIGKPFASSYKPINNKMFLDMIQEAISGIKGAVVESIGSVNNRGRVFVSISIKDATKYKIGDREFKDYLNFGNGHDQSCVLWVNLSDICTVCNNTFSMNLAVKDSPINARVHHRGDVEYKISNIAEIVDGFLGTQAFFKSEFERLMNEPLKNDQARELFAGWTLRNDPEKELSTRGMNKVNRLVELFNTGAGNSGSNRADAFSAVTDYYTHESTRGGGQNSGNQFVSSEFGMGRVAKDNFWDIIRDNGEVNLYTTIGKAALASV
jgi:hypothetical protein